MNIGIFGGSFNPPHCGHLVIAESVREQARFDKILFIPSATTPNKSYGSLAPAHDRLDMTLLAVQGNREFEVSDVEILRSGVSYTIDTIQELSNRNPRDTFGLILGTDNLLEFQTWKSPQEIISRVQLVVVNRPGISREEFRTEISRHATFVNVPQIGISSTDIRRRIKLHRSIRYLVPQSVEEYIRQKGLYNE